MKNSENNNFFILYANCQPVKGACRSVICDLQKSRYYYIPNDLFEILKITKTTILKDIYESYGYENASILDEYFDYLLKNNLGFIDSETNIFPNLSLEWDSSSKITNCILDVDKLSISKINYKSIFKDLNELNCICVQIRSFDQLEISSIEELLSLTNDSRIREIRLVLEYGAEIESFVISRLLVAYKRLNQVIFYNSDRNCITYELGVPIIYVDTKKLSAEDCGQICPGIFLTNIPHFTESLHFNSCLNRKVSIDNNGFIKNCPSQKENFGNINEINIASAISNSKFQRLGKIKKDNINICKDCEHRYICTDCRVFTTDKNNEFAKPSKCSYDPYTGTWA
jgi:SPASM domain peptide maturase of grasp-with-spasm system